MEPAVPGVSAYSLPKNGEKKQKNTANQTAQGVEWDAAK